MANIIRWRPPDPGKRKPGAGGTGLRKSDPAGKLINFNISTESGEGKDCPHGWPVRQPGRPTEWFALRSVAARHARCRP